MRHNSVYMMGGISRSSKVILIRFWAWLDNCFQLDNNSFHCFVKAATKKYLSKKSWVILSFRNPALWNHLDSELDYIRFLTNDHFPFWPEMKLRVWDPQRSQPGPVLMSSDPLQGSQLSICGQSVNDSAQGAVIVRMSWSWHGHVTLHDDHGDHVTTNLSLKSLMSSQQQPATRSREKLFC